MPFKINFTVVIFLILGLLMGLMAWFTAQSLWFGSDAGWDQTSFAMLSLYLTFALIFLALAAVIGYYSKKGFPARQFTRRQVLTVGLLIVGGLTMWIVGIVYLSKFINKQVDISRSAETPAEIVSESQHTSGGKKPVTTYTVKYTYTVDNRAYQAVSHSFERLKGKNVKACYNPANPQSSQIRDNDFQCGRDSND